MPVQRGTPLRFMTNNGCHAENRFSSFQAYLCRWHSTNASTHYSFTKNTGSSSLKILFLASGSVPNLLIKIVQEYQSRTLVLFCNCLKSNFYSFILFINKIRVNKEKITKKDKRKTNLSPK